MHAALHHPWHMTWWRNTAARDKSDRVGSFATDCRILAIMFGLPRPSRPKFVGPIAQAIEMPLVTAPPVSRLSSSMVVGNTQWGWPAAA